MIKSVINSGGYTFPGIENTPGLHPEQLVADALRVMLAQGDEALPIVEEGKCIGIIYLKDLTDFLYGKADQTDLLSHKLNFDLGSAIITMHREFNQAIPIDPLVRNL